MPETSTNYLSHSEVVRELTKATRERLVEEELKDIHTKILDAVAKGRYEIQYDFKFDESRKTLKSLGFSVYKLGYELFISWSE